LRRAETWRAILTARPIDDEEVDQLLSEIRFTPLYVAGAIANHLKGEMIDLSSLVPSDIRYYDRLVGDPDGQTELKSFVDGIAASRIMNWLNVIQLRE
jgi:hypothetical protein